MADSCYDRALSTDDVVISWLWLRSPDLVQPPQHVHSLNVNVNVNSRFI